ncbi:MAG: hypothetical protein NTZ65_01815 [Candidatus Berkelbacteria bacterium]|nr:hypothetical protein [Candidatus Berkelbacteria bacterium]
MQNEKPLETNTSAGGNKTIKLVVYVVIVILVLAVIYYLTRQNANTFKINM